MTDHRYLLPAMAAHDRASLFARLCWQSKAGGERRGGGEGGGREVRSVEPAELGWRVRKGGGGREAGEGGEAGRRRGGGEAATLILLGGRLLGGLLILFEQRLLAKLHVQTNTKN